MWKATLEVLLLSIASSTDNFMVGLSVGISGRRLGVEVNVFISFCNASGAGLAAFLGGTLQQSLPPYLAPLLAAVAFGILGIQDLREFRQKKTVDYSNIERRDSKDEQTKSVTSCPESFARALQLAIPMTLNNLAGGVAGGAFGVTPVQAFVYALIASCFTMSLGYRVGRYVAM